MEEGAGTKTGKNNALKMVLIALGVLVLGGFLFFLFGSDSGDVLEHYGDGKLKLNYSVNSGGWILKYYFKENNFTSIKEEYADKIEEEMKNAGLNLNGEGEVVVYHENGNKAAEIKGTFRGNDLNGEGEVVTYHDNGKKETEGRGTFRGNDLNGEGEFILYHENGNKQGEFKGMIVTDGKNINGDVEYFIAYDENGSKMTQGKGTIKDNELIGEMRFYDGNGNAIKFLEGTIRNGELNGEGRLIIYYEDGSKKQEQIGTFKFSKLTEGNVYDYDGDAYTSRKV